MGIDKPITPQEAIDKKQALLPGLVFRVFNDAITESWDGRRAIVKQLMVAKQIADLLGITEHEVYERKYLNVQEYYRYAGWDVTYPRYQCNSTHDPEFEFLRSDQRLSDGQAKLVAAEKRIKELESNLKTTIEMKER